jgi:hypothetical protein
MNGDKPGKPPKPFLKALKVDKQLKRLAPYWGGRTKRKGAFIGARTRTYPHAHTHIHTHLRACTHVHACTHVRAHTQVHNARTHKYTTHAHTYVHAHKQTRT